MQKILGIDLDNVIVDFVPSFLKFFNNKYGRNIIPNHITTYNIWECGIGNTKEESNKYALEFCYSDRFYSIPLVKGAKEAVNQLARKYPVHIVTARSEELRKQTDEFLRRHFPDTPLNVRYSGDFFRVQNKTKAQICEELGINVMIEDNLQFARECSQLGITVYLLNKPWNQGDVDGNITRVDNWQDILRQL